MAFEAFRDIEEYEIFDFHTHPYRNPAHNAGIYPHLLALDTKEALVADLSRAGITRFAGSVLRPFPKEEGFSPLARANDDALSLAAALGDAYYPGVHIHPDYVDESCAEIARAADAGYRLVGELVHYACGWDFSHKGLYPILECARARGMVVSLHSSGEADIEGAQALCAAFPTLPFVLAHPGDGARPRHHAEAMKRHANLFLDLSGTGLFRYGTLTYLVREVGAERILFGTDYPICTPAEYVGGVLCERLSRAERSLIFAGNAKRLLRL